MPEMHDVRLEVHSDAAGYLMLYIRPTNPLAQLTVSDCTFIHFSKPEISRDQQGSFMKLMLTHPCKGECHHGESFGRWDS
ncbi:hypothetical protein GTQ99_00365 [Kineococcus sp. T13]|uniref:hypothetical protein n=1 Tax=Kineococcus vitellinus TaxID=2696565 RepID=UPI0014125F38|nr:hypothetical protein [Kineococcus vitellinus]NAZ73884.1 hypothetical protein [Kineococcus vitellinus]